MKYGELNLGQVEAVVNKLGGMEGVQKLLCGEITVFEPGRAWREQDGVIYFSVTSNSTTGKQWIKRLESKGFRLSYHAKRLLRSPDFKPTDGITTEVAVLKGMLFKDNDRITKKIRVEADRRGLTKPNAEVACLIRERLSDEELKAMGFWWIIAMHEPINVAGGDPRLLSVGWHGHSKWLLADYGVSGLMWGRENGFAFVASQV